MTSQAPRSTWTLESVDTSGLGRAPNVEYALSDDRSAITGEPPGGRIRITALTQDARRSRIELVNSLTGETFADVEATMVATPSVGDDWDNPLAYFAELAAALYWSMWRMQQVKALGQAVSP